MQGKKATVKAIEPPWLSDHHQNGALTMAKKEFTASTQGKEQGVALPPKEYEFQPVKFSRPEVAQANLPGGVVQDFADEVETLSTGAATILRLIEWDEQREENNEADPEAQPSPVLNDFHRNALLRLVAANMDSLAKQADHLKGWAYRHHTPEGKTEELADAMRLVRKFENLAKGVRG
jgi:hypothetical protein